VDIVLKKLPITLDILLANLREKSSWKWSRSTLYRALLRLGFSFSSRKHDYYARLKEDEQNVLRRAHYLQYFFRYEAENRVFVYLDESWVNQNLTNSRVWTDGTKDCEDMVPPGKGPRWIMLGSGSKEHGWLLPTWSMWKGCVKSEDYHTEMNQEVFAHWVHNRLLPHIPENAVIVLDRAPYHKMLLPECKAARTNFTKEQVADWLVAHDARDETGAPLTKDVLLNEPFPVPIEGRQPRMQRGWSKQALLAKAAELKPPPQYLLQRWADEYNSTSHTHIKVLFLPVAHPHRNDVGANQDACQEVQPRMEHDTRKGAR